MKKLVLQWHITNKCNKRCKHCYQENYNGKEFSIEELIEIANQYIDLLKEYNKLNNQNIKGHINLTGGEPFVREDIFQLLDYFKKHQKLFDFAILTNGSLLDEKVVCRLKEYNPKSVQISLDGNKLTHNNIRGKGSYEEVVKALKLLHKYKIKSIVSFTANNTNYKEFSEVVKIGRKYMAYKVWTDRMVPIGCSNNSAVTTLSKEEVLDYIKIVGKEQKKLINRISKLKIGGERSLQFLNGVSTSYNCSAGDGLIIILENGDVMPCRRLPIIAGNIKEESLKNIYLNSKVFTELRSFKGVPKGCEKCTFLNICRGGAKCIAYGVYGDYKYGDYGCFLRKINKVDIK